MRYSKPRGELLLLSGVQLQSQDHAQRTWQLGQLVSTGARSSPQDSWLFQLFNRPEQNSLFSLRGQPPEKQLEVRIPFLSTARM